MTPTELVMHPVFAAHADRLHRLLYDCGEHPIVTDAALDRERPTVRIEILP